MSSHIKNTRKFFNTKFGFFVLIVALFWLKTYISYRIDFTLGAKGGLQQFLLVVNPIPAALLIFGIALYFRGKIAYWLMLIIDLIESIWIFANVLYYREFSDFLSFGIIKGSGTVQNNLGKSLAEILHPLDFFVFADIIILILLLLFKVIKVDYTPFKKKNALAITVLSFVLMFAEFGISNADRSGLLTRTFDNNYIVKYLGLNEYAAFNAYQTHKESQTRAKAKASDLDDVFSFLKKNRSKANIEYYGKAKGKNVFIIHLESFQQFLIDYKVDGKEVTPNLNKFYHNQNTISFDNFYHQVAQGKTSDAEMMLENSLFGLPEGSAMVTYGTQNTYQAAPAILAQRGYSTAAFHGDVPSFWNRDNAYKSWGYQYFFDSNYYTEKPSYSVGYGLKDKIFFKDAAKYIQQLPQPFYAKLITLTNHYPYELDKQNVSFPATKTGDNTVDPYVQTAHYLDQAFGEFLNYLTKTGLIKNSMIVLYGDHYGISNNHRPAIAQLLHKQTITSYDLAQFQKVPFMIHMQGLKGGINHTYGGEIDVLPTLLHLLGVKDDNTVQFGNDLLSKKRNQIVAFRNGDFVSPKYTVVSGTVYNTKTGAVITPNAKQQAQIKKMQNHVTTELSLSDKVVLGDLLRFYTPKGFTKVNKKEYSYKYADGMKLLKEMDKKKKTDLLNKLHKKDTLNLYKTDAPELK
ncbi:LTA synthase family protein [Apilactobacillus apinorum]|uniref:LTA synthase family protein n=1 Tax=Apilactobacillus apinorum TaxID=1218495 RepID=A0ABP9ZGD1_9LACO|nr:LTA synthase family protein [Apilactobacillus apinorum]KOY68551.1 Phosphoglycerol transferase related protein, alkaline phosphatase superfamily [Apilactobacillus apinorum]CAI2682470.1 Phosphoglycerol transferase related protein, alkaline phosphatase superfamily [Apilactobacillus apinorum]